MYSVAESEADTILPDPNGNVYYAEGLRTSHRNKAVTPAFPFGHGLSYSEFDFGLPTATECNDAALCVTLPLTNKGPYTAATVAQLYVEFPPEADMPAPLLKGFFKTTELLPSSSTSAAFLLTMRDVSYYMQGSWVQAKYVTLHLAASSADFRQSIVHTFEATLNAS